LTQSTFTAVFIVLVVIAVGGLAIVGILLYRLSSQSRMKSRLTNFVRGSELDQTFTQTDTQESLTRTMKFEGLRGRYNQALAIFSTDDLRLKIASAYWPISDIEFISLRILVAIFGLIVGWIIPQNIIGGLGLGILLYLVPGFVLDRAIIKRRRMFQEQLLDFLILIKGAIIAGYSLSQALDMAVKEIPPPTCEEFAQVLREVKFGYSLEQALQNLTNRMQSDDLQIVVTAIMLNAQMGGNLSTVLEATIDTIRERIHLLGEIRSLTSYSRFVGGLVTLLPFITGLIVFLINPDFFDTVKTSIVSQMILLLAFIGVILGNFLIRRIMNVRV
jgi:tight adherence protein B